MKTLIIYYSRTNTTKKIAEKVGEKLGAQLVEIKSPEMKKGFWGFLRAGKQALKKMLPEIEDIKVNLDEFDLIVIGTPIWAGTIASPLRTFLVQNKGKFKEVAFFCTCGDKQTRAFKDIEKLIEKQPKATFELNKKEMKMGYQQKLEDFIKQIER
ncbi:MAG: hypothetical protein PF549_01880 [Patescibacteria group bacterium]|jgi:flavodoxin|nr:hypothetical protein [Patescibacteria group bacterium]